MIVRCNLFRFLVGANVRIVDYVVGNQCIWIVDGVSWVILYRFVIDDYKIGSGYHFDTDQIVAEIPSVDKIFFRRLGGIIETNDRVRLVKTYFDTVDTIVITKTADVGSGWGELKLTLLEIDCLTIVKLKKIIRRK